MKHVWVYIIVIAGGEPLKYPVGVTVGSTEHECWVNGGKWFAEKDRRRFYHNILTVCVPNEIVDKEYPTLRWL